MRQGVVPTTGAYSTPNQRRHQGRGYCAPKIASTTNMSPTESKYRITQMAKTNNMFSARFTDNKATAHSSTMPTRNRMFWMVSLSTLPTEHPPPPGPGLSARDQGPRGQD